MCGSWKANNATSEWISSVQELAKDRYKQEWWDQVSQKEIGIEWENAIHGRWRRSLVVRFRWRVNSWSWCTSTCHSQDALSLEALQRKPPPPSPGRLERHRAPTRNAHVPATMASRESTVEILFPHTFQFSFDTLISLLVLVLLFPFVNKNAFYSNVELVQRYFVLDGEDVSQKNNYKSFWTCDERIRGLWMNTWINKSVMRSLVRWITSKKKSN